MTEYSVEKFYDKYAIKQEDTIVTVLDSGTNAKKVCNLLNEQEEEIQRLNEENQRLKDTIDGLSGTMAHMEDLCDGDVE